MPRLNRVTLTDRKYAQIFVSKSEDHIIEPEIVEGVSLFDINVGETYPQTCGVSIDQDCNWFLASGTIPQRINSCQLGVMKPLELTDDTELDVTFPGAVTYSVRQGKIERQGFRCWGETIAPFVEPPDFEKFRILIANPGDRISALGTNKGITIDPGQMVLAFKLDSTVGTQLIYAEYGPIFSSTYGPRIQIYWDGSAFRIFSQGTPPQVIPYNGNPTDWHELSIIYDGSLGNLTSGFQARIDDAAPTTATIIYFIPPATTVDQFIGATDLSNFNGFGQYAMFRYFSVVRPFIDYHCEDLNGLEPNALVITPFYENVGNTASNIVTALPYWTLDNNASWFGTYNC